MIIDLSGQSAVVVVCTAINTSQKERSHFFRGQYLRVANYIGLHRRNFLAIQFDIKFVTRYPKLGEIKK